MSTIQPISSQNSQNNLTLLKQRLIQVTQSWAIEDYRNFVTYYTKILPKFMDVERCTVYIMEIGSEKICSIFGTGLGEMQIEPPLEGSIVGRVIRTGKSNRFNDLTSQPGFHLDMAEQTGFTCHNSLCSPIKSLSGNGVTGAVQLLNKNHGQPFTAQDTRQLDKMAHFLSMSIESIALNQEIVRIARYLNQEVDRLKQFHVKGRLFISESKAMREVLELVRTVSNTPVNVLIQGENGTGKELISRMIHENSDRHHKPFIPVNCACIPENLIESEFFGHEKGAFTGAEITRIGRFEEANGGTIFLDEIGEMPISNQPKFLRAIQESEGSRLGSNAIIKYNLRLISATNKDLSAEVAKGNFREDLFFRLFSVEITIPPLRDRTDDILPLALHFLEETENLFNKTTGGFTPEILNLFELYPWPGNIRQLNKEVERLVALTPSGKTLSIETCSRDLLSWYKKQDTAASNSLSDHTLAEQVRKLESQLINRALTRTSGNKSQAARILKITRQGLLKKMKRYSLQYP